MSIEALLMLYAAFSLIVTIFYRLRHGPQQLVTLLILFLIWPVIVVAILLDPEF